MMTLSKIEKQIINPVPQGGIPVFADDLLRVQENAKNSTLAFYEGLKVGGFRFGDFPPGGGQFFSTPGLFLNIPEYEFVSENATTSTWNVSSFFAYLDGEICFYPGGQLTFAPSTSVNVISFAAIKGQAIKETRVFKDGNSKESLVTHEIELHSCTYILTGWACPPQISNDVPAVCIDPRYNSDSLVNDFSKQRHPNWYATNTGIGEALEMSQRNENLLAETLFNPTTINNSSEIVKLRFWLDGVGNVKCRGTLSASGASDGDVFFTFPAGFYSTLASRILPIAIAENGNIWAIQIKTNGEAVLLSPTGLNSPFTGFIYFDGVAYTTR